MVEVSARAGMPLWIPDESVAIVARRSGTPKATKKATRMMANRTVKSLWRWSDERQVADRLRRELVLVGIDQRNR